MSKGEINLDLIDIETNTKKIDLMINIVNDKYPDLKHNYTKSKEDVIELTFIGLGLFKCLACKTSHILEPSGVKFYYNITTDIGYLLCPGVERYKSVNGSRLLKKTYIVYSSDDIKGPIVSTQQTDIVYDWLTNKEGIQINRKDKGRGIGATPLYDRFVEFYQSTEELKKIFTPKGKTLTKTKFTHMIHQIIGLKCTGQQKGHQGGGDCIYFYLNY